MKNYEYTQHDFERRSSRNFVKENVNNIKQIQGVIHMNKSTKLKFVKGADKFQSVPQWVPDSQGDTPTRAEKAHENVIKKQFAGKKSQDAKIINEGNLKAKTEKGGDKKSEESVPSRFSHRSIQTERTDDPAKLYETGVIKYASTNSTSGKSKFTVKTLKQPSAIVGVDGDTQMDESDGIRKDYIKENMQNFKPKTVKSSAPKVLAEPPPTYQKGVLPKYLQERKAENTVPDDDECPPGHVLLPESERKETLKVLRQSYADRIQELNGLPVRSDTLRVKKKKMEIEEELKKIDSGIKVFQRQKVYVKINS